MTHSRSSLKYKRILRSHLIVSSAYALLKYKAIEIPLTRAKALRMFLEPLITLCKEDNMHSRSRVYAKLRNKEAVTQAFELAKQYITRPGGYMRVLHKRIRSTDNCTTAHVEFV